jgi:positive regulator of sigma E activity
MKDKRNHELIEHDGIVRQVNPNNVIVEFSSDCNCSGCHAEALCNISGKHDKSIEISGNYNVSPGDTVTVLMKEAMGYKAVILGYLIPLMLVIAGLSVMVSIGLKEFIAGIGSIAILVPYFFLLRLFRERINSSFTFSIREE